MRRADWKKVIVLLALMLLLLLSSCKTVKTEYVPVETVKTEYVHQTDSIYVTDSIISWQEAKNDTIIIYKTKIKKVYVAKHDTIVERDTVTVVQPVEVVKWKNKLYTWQIILMTIGGVTVVVLVLGTIYKIKR